MKLLCFGLHKGDRYADQILFGSISAVFACMSVFDRYTKEISHSPLETNPQSKRALGRPQHIVGVLLHIWNLPNDDA